MGDYSDFFQAPRHASFINGQFVQETAEKKQHISPVTNTSWTTLQFATPQDVQKALHALPKSIGTTYERAEMLHGMANFLEHNQDAIAKIITLEMGKVIRDACSEVDYAINYLRWFAEEAKRIFGQSIPSPAKDKKIWTTYTPIGPCFVLTPWNYPLAMGARKIAPAIAAGCPVIARPSSLTPVSLLTFGAAAQVAQLPPGALNILIGDTDTIVNPLMQATQIKKFSFTGSTAVGTQLYQAGAASLKKASLELGGNAPLLIFDDADLDHAVHQTLMAKFRVNGQTCICANRILVQKSMYEPFIKKLKDHVKQLYIGDPFDNRSDLSTVLHPASQKKVIAQKADALAKGARPVLISEQAYEPQIIADITTDMHLFQEETFGPLAGIMPFESDAEGFALANKTIHGLAAYIFTRNIQRCETAIQKLDFGIIGVNDGRPSCVQMPFGGMKASGFGKEGGPDAIYEYLNQKAISLWVPSPSL